MPQFLNSDEVDAPPVRPKKYNKFYFRDLCRRLKIINEKHYQKCLKTEFELQECELYMKPAQVEGYKKLIFVHNFKSVSRDFERPRVFEIRDRNRLGIVCRFVKTIALENNTYFAKLIKHLSRWYFCRNHKKFGILCYGATNSGKSLLADLLCSEYRNWEIGAFSCPPGTNVSQFHLDNLLNTFVYRCDEMVFENISIVQRMKNLLEGSRLMDTDVKYKSKQQILPNPTFISMNGRSVNSVFKWCSEEQEPFQSRCIFLKMNIPLKHRINSEDFKYLAESGKEFIYLLSREDINCTDTIVSCSRDYTSDICL